MKTKTGDKTVAVIYSADTKQIVLPEGMSNRDGMEWLARKEKEDQREVSIHEVVDAYPFDGALALHKTLAKIYGWVDLAPTPGFFGSSPPKMVGVRTGPGPDDTVQVPWGTIQIPGISGSLTTGIAVRNGRPMFTIGGVVKRKHEKEVAEIAKLTRGFVREESIYRGKPIKVAFPDAEEASDLDDFNPRFLDLSDVRPEELVFSKDVMTLISTNLFTPIEQTQLCRDHQIPLKRGILLAGPYGVGKTLTAYVAAKKCAENGWTFVYLDSVADLERAIYFAQQYAPAMIFAEDIDQVLNGSDRTEAVNRILNTIDGVDTKASEMLVVLTTNHVDRINQAMLRPGRLDAVISVGPPDTEAAIRLVRQYGRGLVADTADLHKVGETLDGSIPAVIREVVERAKLAAISRMSAGDVLTIEAADLLIASDSMITHLELLKPKAEDPRSNAEKAAEIKAAATIEAAHIHNSAQRPPNGKGSGDTSSALRPRPS